jgi:hypothetical protein
MYEEDDFIEVEKLPLFQKGQEIVDTVLHIAELIPEENEALSHVKGFMISDATTLTIRVIAAHHSDLYDLKMESAALIRKAARDLVTHHHGLRMFGFEEYSYFKIVLDLIEEYRLLFIDWVSCFDDEDYVIDRWGLFNPPGVGPFDHDPDDDIPFDPEDEFPFDI